MSVGANSSRLGMFMHAHQLHAHQLNCTQGNDLMPAASDDYKFGNIKHIRHDFRFGHKLLELAH